MAIPGGAAHTGTTAWTACMAVPRQPWSFSSSPSTPTRASTTIDGSPATSTRQPRPVGQSGASSGPTRVTCSTVRAGRPSITAVAEKRIAETVPGSTRPAATSSGRSATATARAKRNSSIVAPNPSATICNGARKTPPSTAGSAPSTGASGARPKPMTSKSMNVLG